MKTAVQFPEEALILDQASAWVAKMVADTMSEADREALDQWLAESPAHSKALLECADTWDDLDELAQLADMFPRKQPQKVSTTTPTVSTWFPSKGFGLGAIAASAVFAAMLILIYPGTDQPSTYVHQTVTAVGEYRTAVLPDGSKAMLNTDSQIEATFDPDDAIRRVALIKGEAHFDVEPDPSRPFVVEVGDTRVVAVGTAFNVDSSSGRLEVTVTEGIVEIHVGAAEVASPGRTQLQHERGQQFKAGQIAIISKHQIESVGFVEAPEIERKLLWQQGKVQFVGEPLSQVVRELSRHTHYTFKFSDTQVGDIRVGGYFQLGDIDELLDVLSGSFNIEVKRDTAGVIHLASREPTSSSG
ncbi:FecR family protein [Congregibacter litoralis]|uniref:FecR family protein n=1 Tax=Congregibacter litoralis KT71 TaxID=314285 RepID=A4ABA5_9GAMM|nr:FecR domain-containing protein [Congregibacter litoralis]EAQ96659.1 FecR family protein [Congregibacter litoralis KT71]